MIQDQDLKKLERRAYLTYHGDGLWDLFLGATLFGVGFMMKFNAAYLAAIFPAVLLPSAISVKKAVAQKRLGFVKFSPERQAKEKRNVSMLLVLFSMTALAGLVAFYAFIGDADWQLWIRNLRMIPFGFVLSVILIVLGLLYGIYRFVLYGIMILAVFISSHLANSEPAVYFLFPGAMFILVGIFKLIVFLRRYPVTKEGNLT